MSDLSSKSGEWCFPGAKQPLTSNKLRTLFKFSSLTSRPQDKTSATVSVPHIQFYLQQICSSQEQTGIPRSVFYVQKLNKT